MGVCDAYRWSESAFQRRGAVEQKAIFFSHGAKLERRGAGYRSEITGGVMGYEQFFELWRGIAMGRMSK